MKKILSLISVLLVVALFTGCSLLPSTTPVEEKAVPNKALDVFRYDNVTYKEDQVLVRTNGKVTLEAILEKKGSEVVKEWSAIDWKLVTVPAGQDPLDFIKQLRKMPGVIMAEPNMEYQLHQTPTVERYERQWGFENMKAEAAWDITTGSLDVIVAIVDTGVDIDHPEFADKTIVGAADMTGSEQGVFDLADHGTHVAGIAADDGRTGKISGVAWDCPLMPVRVMNDSGSIWTSYLIDAMIYLGDYAVSHPEKRIVANMSIGGRGYNFAFKDAIDYAAAEGVLLVTSAGNDTKRLPSYPSTYNGVLTVAASTPYDTKADFSTEGTWNSVAAPGVLIYSTVPSQFYDDPYQNMQGTSMASPYVCGAAALLLSEYPDLTPLEIKNQIEQTANGEGFTEELGHGIIDMEAMLGELQPMAYGSLDVTSNVVSTDLTGWIGTAVITVLDENDSLVGFGTTGEYGNYLFHALKPGTYTVTASYYDLFAGGYDIVSDTATITAGTSTTLNLDLAVPSEIIRTLVYFDDIDTTAEGTSTYQVPITIVEAGMFEFETAQYNDVDCDTTLAIYDADGNQIAFNDDHLTRYSYIATNLAAGDYTVVVANWDETAPLIATFNIYSSEVVY